jgi:hypothetical protein
MTFYKNVCNWLMRIKYKCANFIYRLINAYMLIVLYYVQFVTICVLICQTCLILILMICDNLKKRVEIDCKTNH